MLTKDERPGLGQRLRRPRLMGGSLPLALVVVGLAALLILDGEVDPDPESSALHRYLRETETEEPAAEPANTLATLRLEVPPDSAAVLQNTRDRALETGLIQQTEADTVAATVVFEGRRMPAEVRIKGDWTDHVSTDQWSLRIRLDEDRLLGMRVFSIQAPATVGYLGEWLVLEAMRRENVLAPRSTFVNVVINDNAAGIYFLQEHFSKELLESQGRREGPIVVWDESTHWNALLQAGLELPGPYPTQPAFRIDTAETRAYGERRLSSIESLASGLSAAVEKMRALQAMAVADRSTNERLRALQALDDLRGRTIEELVDTDRLACAHALASLFRIEHSLWWHNMRFYHDPVLDRLEPIQFDNMLHLQSDPDPVVFRARGFPAVFTKSTAYTNAVFRYLGRFVQPEYLEELLADLGPELERFEPLVRPRSVSGIVRHLTEQQAYLRSVVIPQDPVNFLASYELESADPGPGESRVRGTLRVEAWSTTRVPVVLAGFRFSNGSVVDATRAIEADSAAGSSVERGAVVLPVDGRPVRFAFAMDERLANLRTVEQIKSAVREQLGDRGALQLEVEALFRPLASEEWRAELLAFRRFDPAWAVAGGRPRAPSLAEVLDAHAFLELEPVSGELVARPGQWDVEGDLVLPDGVTLRLLAGTTLRFQASAVLVATAPLHFDGSAEAPVVLEPRSEAPSWKGIAVLDARGRSTWSHVEVRATDAVTRAGWSLTGAVTFYRSPLTLADCTFAGTLAEDALNVFGTDLLFERVTFSDCPSDAFDGDFVSGALESCSFSRGGGDGADFSGSSVQLTECTFEGLADKAISAGEGSSIEVLGGRVADVSVGVAAKDGSSVNVRDLEVERARSFALAVYVKKPEYGPASLTCTGGRIEGESVVQTGCRLSIDGAELPGQALDVERLYREGVLGR